ncbi:thioredoxin [Enterococcus sp. JM4C]|uniref:DsbA family oxidoreductase n=1 Tax=Candidatus Enterococcus huntleyi TaxID=1857217 RepID=UPI00137A5698|nr:DsbA family protein [Enterococcus sp. JM4C]KAF1297369.1 thioredoxin [Enterococcus sp. JM4C]
MKIEFFHDVICSFCFPMSYRMHEVKAELPEIEIIHRSFALGWEPADFEAMFGSRKAVKPEVLNHWAHANQNDTLHRFNIEGMRQTDFDFPTSKNALLAAKAALLIGTQETYWEVFDKLQEGLFVRNLNIEDIQVLEELVQEASVDFTEWKQSFKSPENLAAVKNDFALAEAYGLKGVPALIIDGKYLISGAQPKENIVATIRELLEKEKKVTPLIPVDATDATGGSCNFEDGKWNCD